MAVCGPSACSDSIRAPVFLLLQVEQSYALVPMEQQFAAIYNVLRRHAEETPDHKVRDQNRFLFFGCDTG